MYLFPWVLKSKKFVLLILKIKKDPGLLSYITRQDIEKVDQYNYLYDNKLSSVKANMSYKIKMY